MSNDWAKAFDSPHEAQEFCHDWDAQGSDLLESLETVTEEHIGCWWWASDNLQTLVSALIPSGWAWTISHERASGFVELDFVTCCFVFCVGSTLYLFSWGLWLLFARWWFWWLVRSSLLLIKSSEAKAVSFTKSKETIGPTTKITIWQTKVRAPTKKAKARQIYQQSSE